MSDSASTSTQRNEVSCGGKRRKLLCNLEQVVQVSDSRQHFLAGDSMQNECVTLRRDATQSTGLSIVIDLDSGSIEKVSTDEAVQTDFNLAEFTEIVRLPGCSAIPGFVDAHTHALFAGDRVQEFIWKLEGVPYMQIHNQGGGIQFSVKCTTEASEEELYKSLRERLECMVRCGTTTVEVKTGYGLKLEAEKKLLRVLKRAKHELHDLVDLVITYCGAHSVPVGETSEEATHRIVENDLPTLFRGRADGELHFDTVDVFCEGGVFSLAETRRICESVIHLNEKHNATVLLNIHGDELSEIGAGLLCNDVPMRAIAHLEEVTDEEIEKMSASRCAALILPTTAHTLRLRLPRVRDMIAKKCIVALGSDFCPNAYCYAMPVVLNLACVLCRMSVTEALVGATLNSAYAIGMQQHVGSLEPHKQADLVVVNANRYENLAYQLGCHPELIRLVLKRGRQVYSKN